MHRASWVISVTLVAILSAATLLFSQSSSPAAAASSGGNEHWGANYFPNVELTTQDGKQVKFYDDLVKGKMVVINFIYTNCGASCPLETAKLGQVYKILGDRMGKEIFFLSLSIDPKRDTPAVLKQYAEKFHVGPGWYFLTGKKEDIDLVRKKIGMAGRPNEDPLTGHTTSLTIGNEATGQWMQDSSLDDARYIAVMVGDWLSSWQHSKPGESYANRPKIDPEELELGAKLFRTTCSACHTIGNGDSIGPDLANVSRVRDHAWVARFIQVPDQMLGANDPIATALYKKYREVAMPNLRLGPGDAEALIRYIDSKASNIEHQHMSHMEELPTPQAAASSSNR